MPVLNRVLENDLLFPPTPRGVKRGKRYMDKQNGHLWGQPDVYDVF